MVVLSFIANSIGVSDRISERKTMSKNTRRGYTPEDERLFSEKSCHSLYKAAKDLKYLLDAGYPIKPASTFIGNHYLFNERQRLAITRVVSSKNSVDLRQKKRLAKADCITEVNIDGFNTVISLEVALSKAPILKCMDQTMRDLAGLRGTYRIIEKTEIAIHEIFHWLGQNGIQKANLYLDAPVSNSGRLKVLFYELSKSYPIELKVEVIHEVDRILEKAEHVITSDAIILDRCKSWLNMNEDIIKHLKEPAWVIDFVNESMDSMTDQGLDSLCTKHRTVL